MTSEAEFRKQADATPDEKKAWVVADDCISCGACVSACPTNAIEMGSNAAQIDRGLCIGPGACVIACPVDCIKIGVEDPARSSGSPQR